MANVQPIEDVVAVPDASPTETVSTSTSAIIESKHPGVIRHDINLHGDGVRPLVGLELPVYGSDMNKRSKRKRIEEEKKEENNDTEAITPDGYRIKAEVVGLVKEKYVCEGMADFQYFTARSFYPTLKPDKDALTVVANTTDAVETAVMNSAVVENGPLSTPSMRQRELQDCLRPYLAVENETQLELIPEVFSKVDLPLKYEFRQRSGYQPTTTAKKTSSTMTYLNFHDDTPAPVGPKPERLCSPTSAEILLRVCRWTWRGSWIKMGYDPRLPEESESASRYQVVELRNNRELVHSKVTHATRKRIKKFVGASSGNANGEGGPVKGPRIVKVTQTSALENAQAAKRRRKERFTRDEQQDKEESDGADDSADNANGTTSATTSGNSDKIFEIFGVQLASPNVLFQLDEIDDDEVREWTAQFTKQSTPSLLGGWYPTQMFLPLREIIRLRIAAMVGRSKAELDTRRKRLMR
ncbi:Transcription factor IIIC, subunit 5 [Phytophthora cactorum]|nr:Transcription factor IIIC, subunit 5 [Phytophthora cactorum]